MAWSNSQLENSHNYIQMLFPLPEGSPYNWEAPVIDLETMKAFRARRELRERLRMSFERMLTFYGFTTSTHAKVEGGGEKSVEVNKGQEQEQSTTEATSVTATTTVQLTQQNTKDAEASPAASADDLTTHNAKAATTNSGTEALHSNTTVPAFPPSYRIAPGPNWPTASSNWCVRFDHNHLRITRILRCLRVLGLQTECDAFFAELTRVYEDPAVRIGNRTMVYWRRAVERPLHLAPDDDECEWLREWEEGEGRE